MTYRLALVTGGSSGIGAALAAHLQKLSIPVITTGRNRDKLIGEGVVADLATPEGRAVVSSIIEKRQPDLVVNSAGLGLYGPADQRSIQEQLDLLEVNVMALAEVTLRAAKTMVASGHKGTILNVSSAAGELTFPHFAAYAASKAFVTNFSKSLDGEFKQKGVRVLVALPGEVTTQFRSRASRGKSSSRSSYSMSVDTAVDHIWKQIETGRRELLFDWKTRVGIAIFKLFPGRLQELILASQISKRLVK